MTITLQALSLVEKVEEPVVQVRTLHTNWRLRDQQSEYVSDARWMDVKVHGFIPTSYMASNGNMFHNHLNYFQNPPLGGRLNKKLPGDYGTPNVHNRWFFCFIICEDWMNRNSSKHIETTFGWGSGHISMTSHYTRGVWPHYMMFGGVLGRPLDTFLLGFHMVTAIGSCVKWP